MMGTAIGVFAGLTVFGLLMFWMGYRLGIQHTEARWSDAVGKSHSAMRRVMREYDASDPNLALGGFSDLRDAVNDLKTFG